MKVIVTGANGYIGSKVVEELCNRNIKTLAVDIANNNIDKRAEFYLYNLFDNETIPNKFNDYDVLIHLAYRNGFVHNSETHKIDLPKHINFLNSCIDSKIKRIIGMGTMHEIGFYEGGIDASTKCNPNNDYGVAKNELRKAFIQRCENKNKNYAWIRAFYIFGNDEKGQSIFSKIKKADLNGEKEFKMSSGEHMFDFIEVNVLASEISNVIMSNETGIFNCSSGYPKRLKDKVNEFIHDNKLSIKPIFGAFRDRENESNCIYGIKNDLKVLIPTHHKDDKDILDIYKKDNVKSDLVITNQGKDNANKVLSVNNNSIYLFNVDNIGVSKNRNNLLDSAKGEICICIDDDCRLVDNYIEIVTKFFNTHKDAEYVLFNGIVTHENNRLIHNKKTKRVKKFNDVAYAGGPGLVFKKECIDKYKIRYNESVGYPNYICAGEDSLFYKDLIKSKAIFYRSNEVLFSIVDDVNNSSYFNGVTDQFVITKGVITKLLHPYSYHIYMFHYIKRIRHWRDNKKGYVELIRLMKKGFKKVHKGKIYE